MIHTILLLAMIQCPKAYQPAGHEGVRVRCVQQEPTPDPATEEEVRAATPEDEYYSQQAEDEYQDSDEDDDELPGKGNGGHHVTSNRNGRNGAKSPRRRELLTQANVLWAIAREMEREGVRG